MARKFNPDAERSALKLPDATQQQIQALILDLDLDFRSVIIRAVHDLWQREIGEGTRDLAAEIDQIRAFVGMPDSAAHEAAEEEYHGRPTTALERG